MKAAKNMDSVFANCTQDELDFDVLFSDDDTIIDFIAGVDEAGELLTGPNFDYSKILEEADMLEDQDDAEARDGKSDHKPAAPEGSKDVDLEVGAEVGDGKEVSGEEKSKESEAHDMTKLGSETAQQTAVQKAMQIAAQKFADKSNDCCKENAEYEGYEELVEAVVNGFMSEEEIMSEDASQIAINTADYLISECADAEARDGKVDPDNKGNIEGVKGEVIDKQTKGSASGDPIADDCDQAARDGKVAPDKNVEGVANRIIGAALEASVTGDIHKDIETQTLDAGVESMNRDIVPDDVRVNTDSNDIDIKQECAVEDTYKKLIGGMKDGLQKLALAKALDESVMETAESIYEAAEGVEESFSDYQEYQEVLEAVVANMSEDQLNMENSAQIAIEATNFIISEGGMRKFERAVARNQAKRDANFKAPVASKATSLVNGGDGTKKNIGGKIADGVKAAGNWIKKNPGKTAGIAAGTAAVAGGAALAAKKIADKKKAAQQNQEEVKENYEYEEYMELVEAVVASLNEEELMSENASEFACQVADYMIENALDAEEIINNDGDDEDIESIASNNDPKVNLAYDYDDDELIDMVANDDQL